MKRRGKAVVALILAMLTVAVGPSQSVTAAETPIGQGLEISPPVIELSASPGQTLTINIKLRNVTAGPLIVKSRADDFVAKGEDGQPKILLDGGDSGPYSLKSWVRPPADLPLAPRELKELAINIVVPSNAGPGGHYGVMRFSGVPPELADTGVSLSASIGTLLLVKVSGNVVEQLTIPDFYVSRQGAKGSFFELGPLAFTERVENTGNVHQKPRGVVKISNTFGRTVARLPINDPPGNILPASVRKFDQTWNKKWLFGRYRATTELSYGPDYGTHVTKSIVFWVIPWKLILFGLFILAVTFMGAKKGLRGYNRRIIEGARGK